MAIIDQSKCTIESCGKPLLCRGLCSKHYRKFIRDGGPKINKKVTCSIDGCNNKIVGKGYCQAHYMRIIFRGGGPDRVYEDHGMGKTKEYKAWLSIKQRCFNPNHTGFADYGGRGITMAEEWRHSFIKFYQDIGQCPSPKHSIERLDVNGNYEPGNVVWAIPSVQAHNQRIRRTSTSGYKGVSWRQDSRKWAASIAFKGKRRHLGLFDTAEEASRAYEIAAKELFSEIEPILPAIFKNKDAQKELQLDKQKAKILNQFKIDSSDSCWIWTGRISRGGYGMAYFNGATRTAHRAVYEILVGDIPGSMQLNHDCHTRDKKCPGGIGCVHRRCVSPSHLSLTTPQENLLLDNTVSGLNAVKTHCIRGHGLTKENVRIGYADGGKVRFCKLCDKIRAERQRERRKQMIAQGVVDTSTEALKGKLCSQGHDLENSYIDSRGYPQCRECSRLRSEIKNKRVRDAKLAVGEVVKLGPKLKTHCINGHELTEANRRNDGRCRTCSNQRSSEYHKQRRREGFKQ